jgi:uncharacterized protein YdaU (DUF1376 family)
MKFYPSDYLSDTQHLTTLEHGAYMLLILNYWQRGVPLFDDDKKLAAIARMDVDQWFNVRSTLVEFFDVQNGFWHHKRVELEMKAVVAKSKKASVAGKISAAKRLESLRNSTDVKQLLDMRPADGQRLLNHTDTDTDSPIHEEIIF